MTPTTEPVAVFLPSLAGGGAERAMLNVSEALYERGYAVDLLVASAEGQFVTQVPSGVHLISFGVRRVSAAVPQLVRYLRRRRPAVLLTAMDHTNLVGLLARWASRTSVRTVISVQVAFSPMFLEAQRGRGRLIRWLAQVTYPHADAVIAVSQGVANSLVQQVRLQPDKVRIIPNPVALPNVGRLSIDPPAHPWFALGQPPVILGVGRLVPQKDFPTLIHAVARLRTERPARLVIIGEGEDRPMLVRLIEELGLAREAELIGFQENPYPYLSRAAVLVLSSAYEGFGNVLVEAMACGTPVVSCDCPSGPSEILDHGRYGPLVAVGDAAGLARAIAKTLDQPPSRSMLLERAGDFAMDRVLPAYLEVLGLRARSQTEGARRQEAFRDATSDRREAGTQN